MRSLVFFFIFLITFIYSYMFFKETSLNIFELKKINKIEIINNNYLPSSYVKSKINVKVGQNFWSFNPIELEKKLISFNEIEDFRFNLEWDGTLKIFIKEKTPFMKWITKDRERFIDEKGNFLNFKNLNLKTIKLFGENANQNIIPLSNVFLNHKDVFEGIKKVFFFENIGWLIKFESNKCLYFPIKKLDNLVNLFQNIKDSELYNNYNFFDLRIIGRIYISNRKC